MRREEYFFESDDEKPRLTYLVWVVLRGGPAEVKLSSSAEEESRETAKELAQFVASRIGVEATSKPLSPDAPQYLPDPALRQKR